MAESLQPGSMWCNHFSLGFIVRQVGLGKRSGASKQELLLRQRCRAAAGEDQVSSLGKGLQSALKLPKDLDLAADGRQAAAMGQLVPPLPQALDPAHQAASYTPAVLLQLNAASEEAGVNKATLQEWQRAYEQVRGLACDCNPVATRSLD
jgi:hypothetical protein